MKFIVFNLIVGAALVYLFTAEQGDLSRITEKAQAMGQQVQQKVSDLAATSEPEKQNAPASSDKAAPRPASAPEPQQAVDEEIDVKVPVKVAKKIEREPQPVPQAMKETEETLPPEVIKRRNEILNGKDENIAQVTQNQSRDRSEQRDRLLRLAEDMELYSLETIAK